MQALILKTQHVLAEHVKRNPTDKVAKSRLADLKELSEQIIRATAAMEQAIHQYQETK